ncbi:MAG TPA: KamA family radical SAM protein [Sedimentisphaerales bacterium]|mgnify:CR=1 FL=1|nr:KamA family radical SAM protein [Sedimentisphaerales bacterium]HRS11260.1 KamA family radical SAM protein [Sedimentisphaerales bacterium]HRV47838.1 KamA family radical SAM protein [Sedimentisphaerales bacterium]
MKANPPHHGKYLTSLDQIEQLDDRERAMLDPVAQRFAFRCSDYYLSLIDWNDPNDPIRRAVVPHVQELEEWGRLDPSDEETYTVMPGLEHKYPSTVLLLVSNVCEGICRYCFRKRVFLRPQWEYLRDIPAAMAYIADHREITNVLLTGGDPLVLATSKLADLVGRIRQIDHVQIIRIGTRTPAFNPYRIIEDPTLTDMVRQYSTPRKRVYVMTHFIHPRELTDVAVEAVDALQKAGAITANQTPLIHGVNDDPETLATLLARLSFIGAVPYYIFQCRPAVGNKAYTVPIETGCEIVEQAKSRVSGLAKRLRYVMSHASGKIEILGKLSDRVYFRYHRAANEADSGRMLAFACNPQACWLDDYGEVAGEHPPNLPYRSHGPE